MASKTPSERFAPSNGHDYHGTAISAYRRQGEDFAQMVTHGRSNAAERQEIADGMATITETATIERVDRNNFIVRFHVTHRIVPVDQAEKEASS